MKVSFLCLLFIEVLMGYVSQLNPGNVKTLLRTLNDYRLWEQFQRIAVALIKVESAKIEGSLHGSLEILVELLKYVIVDPTVVQKSELYSYVPKIMKEAYK